MPASKCPTCGYRNGPAARFCANCNQTLDEAESLPLALPVPLHLRSGRVVPDRLPAPTPDVVVNQTQEEFSPYQNTIQGKALELMPFEALVPAPEPSSAWELLTPLPFGFAWRSPTLVGKIIHLESREQVNDFPNFAGALLALLAEIVWMIPNVQTTREPVDKIEVTRLRIQSEDGQIYDAMVRGSLRGANLSLGDTVSLWGHRRRGNLLVSKGYDHTTRSAIATTATGLLLPALLLLAVVAFGYLALAHLSLADALHRLVALPGWLRDQLFP
jgi:hypothetical protein